MKKAISFVLSVLIVFSACGYNFISFSAAPTLERLSIVSGENGRTYKIMDGNGNVIPFDTSLKLSLTDSGSGSGSSKTGIRTSAASLPESYDSRSLNRVTPVKSQGNSGCCWAFSTISALESDAISKGYTTLDETDFSEAHLAWYTYTPSYFEGDPIYGESFVTDDPYRYGGNWIRSSSALARWSGIAKESNYPFYPLNISAMGNYPNEDVYDHGSGFILNSSELLSSDEDVKRWIIDHGSCTASIYFHANFENFSKDCYYNNDYDAENTPINHMITIIGWNNNFPASYFLSPPPGNGAWLIKDSNGLYHGDGYFWISYYEPSLQDAVGFTVRRSADLLKNYTYNGAGFSSVISNGSDTRGANVFVAQYSERISSVSFFLMNALDSVSIDIYRNIPDGFTSPTDGNLAASYTSSALGAGFNTVELPTQVAVNEGSRFSVVLRYNCSDGVPYIPVEANIGNPEVVYNYDAGQSYFYIGDSWYDLRDVEDSNYHECIYGNLYIQAATECNHQFETSEVTATCTKDGMSYSVCTQCGLSGSSNLVKAYGHDFSEWSAPVPSQTSNTYVSTRVCSRCGYTETKEDIRASRGISFDQFMDMIFSVIFRIFGYKSKYGY